MSAHIIEVSEASFEADVIAAERPVLLDLWASWCAPCRALAPVVEKLAATTGHTLQVAKLDTEKHSALSARLNVRSIPTLILFRQGAEVARLSGMQTLEQLRHWLHAQGVSVSLEPAYAGPFAEPPAWGAFYGDEQLRSFLLERLQAYAMTHEVKCARFPYWIDGAGTVSAALIQNTDQRVFERLTGLPYSFACALEFLDLCTADEIDSVLRDVRAGADLRAVAVQLMHAWLTEPLVGWSTYLDDAPVDGLRQRWAACCERWLAGGAIAPEEWADIRHQAKALHETTNHKSAAYDPYRAVQDTTASLLEKLSPSPAADDIGAWQGLMLLGGTYTKIGAMLHQHGWTRDDLAVEGIVAKWFKARQALEPGGKFSSERLALAHEEKPKHLHTQEYQDKHALYRANYYDWLAPLNQALRGHIRGFIQRCPGGAP